MRAAAIFIVMIGVGTGIYIRHGSGNNVVILHPFSGSQVRSYTLPDGSLISLDPNSSLSYPSQFISDQRDVRLEGGAFFTVAPDPRKPFRVMVNEITITVLGTSFSITSSSGRTEIVVKTGSIEVAGKRQSLKLRAREKLTVLGVDTGWVKGSDSSDNGKTNQEIGSKASGKKLGIQKPDLRSLPPATIPAQVAPAVTSAVPPFSTHPRPKFDDAEMKKREEQMKGIVSELLSDNLIKDYKSLIWFSLTDTAFYINGVREPDSVQNTFKEKYNVSAVRGFFFGPFVVPKIARGMHVNRDWLLEQEEFQ
jgi:hypothetical protein